MRTKLSPWSLLRSLTARQAALSPVSAEQLRAWLAAGDTLLVDVREPEEFRREHLDAAVSVPLSRFPSKLAAPESARRVVFHCQSGNRTRLAAGRLAASTDLQCFVLTGGLNEWNRLPQR